MSLSRRTFLTGAAGIVAAIGASRIAVAAPASSNQ